MAAPVIVSFFKGRLWCGKFCPRGLFLNLLPGGKMISLPGFIRSKVFRFAFLVILMSAFTVQLAFTDGSIAEVGAVFHRMVAVTTAAAVLAGIIYGKRTWCTVCPMGTLAHYVSVSKKKRSLPNPAENMSCGVCTGCGTRGCITQKSELASEMAGSSE
jgi:polyferredoxin